MRKIAFIATLVLAGCVGPNDAPTESARFRGNYRVIADCAYPKVYPVGVSQVVLESQKTVKLKYEPDGVHIFSMDFVGEGPDVTRVDVRAMGSLVGPKSNADYYLSKVALCAPRL